MANETRTLANDVVAKIRKKHGDAIFMLASEFSTLAIPRIPSGIFMLDYALGGGFPVGRMSVVWGLKSAAKTTTFLKTIANAQKMCANCWKFAPCDCGDYRQPIISFLDVEGTFDNPWAKKMGIDLSTMYLSIPEYAEQSLDIAESVVLNGCDILVIDSIAFLTPLKEVEESVTVETMGLQARAVGKGIRKFVSAINSVKNERGQGPTLLFTNQVRMKIGLVFGSPETQPGGMAPGFASSTETRMSAGKYEMDDLLGKPVSAEFKFKVEKNKVSSAKIEGEFKLAMMNTETRKIGDALNEPSMVDMGIKIGLVEGAGSKWTALGQVFKAKSLIEKELLTNKEFYDRMHAALMNTLLAE